SRLLVHRPSGMMERYGQPLVPRSLPQPSPAPPAPAPRSLRMPAPATPSHHPHRLAAVLAALVLLPAPTPAAEAPRQSFLRTYCVGCHNAEARKGGLDLEALPADTADPAAFAAWVKVHDRLRAGEMP